MVTEQALAKINLALHVTGQRADGYHLLDSLVVFAGVGDVLHASLADTTSLTLAGPFGADIPNDKTNFVARAAALFSPRQGIAFTLQKHLPPASGIGGGSADAAAAIRAILKLHAERVGAPPKEPFPDAVLSLGADVPICLMSRPARMRGIGDEVTTVKCPKCWITLVNPRVEVPTPQVFARLATKTNAAMPEVLPDWPDAATLADWLQGQRNDLEAPALVIAPVIADVLAALRAHPGSLIARMSGSGATCFALSDSQDKAEAIADALRAANPTWWVAASVVFPGVVAPPRIS
ncbi:4-(cytidine 5'-diphospho)-2-C-methyl-D-erythritol kinase [Pseudorhodobacter sp.]|uniref:4-(cytidine 5'-diphospho)-2-C-methyl-D-erythritol kinase n=1 Tax=Pseudorhodobacter sp. TaxID=1934400 RepID=UPI002AFFF664|nr:4-(cytidine 5'-diphospho)-2-C-methyl-D-erythritol kinase [Pseudorhodobacter sp.]